MKIEVTQAEGAVLIALSGEIVNREDQSAASELISQKLEEGERTFVLDLSQVPYVSSLGIAVLVGAHVKVSDSEGKLRLVNPRPKVAKILEMTKVNDFFRTYSSVEEALSAD